MQPSEPSVGGDAVHRVVGQAAQLAHRPVPEDDPARRGLGQHHAHRHVVQHRRQTGALGFQGRSGLALGLAQPGILRDQPRLADLLGEPRNLDRRGRLIRDGGQRGLVFVDQGAGPAGSPPTGR